MKQNASPSVNIKVVPGRRRRLLVASLVFLAVPFLAGAVKHFRAFPILADSLSDPTTVYFLLAWGLPLLGLLLMKIPKAGWLFLLASVLLIAWPATPANILLRLGGLAQSIPPLVEWAAGTGIAVSGLLTGLTWAVLAATFVLSLLAPFSTKTLKLSQIFLTLFAFLYAGGIAALEVWHKITLGSLADLEMMAFAAIPAFWVAGFAFFAGGLTVSSGSPATLPAVPEGRPSGYGISMNDFRQPNAGNPAMAGLPQMGYPGYPQPAYPQGYPPQGYYGPIPPNPYAPVPPPADPRLNGVSASRFTGQPVKWLFLNLGAFFLTILTVFLGLPAAVCMVERYRAAHTVIDGRRMKFDGKAGDLFGKWIGWLLLSVLTVGIFLLYLPAKVKQWTVRNTHWHA